MRQNSKEIHKEISFLKQPPYQKLSPNEEYFFLGLFIFSIILLIVIWYHNINITSQTHKENNPISVSISSQENNEGIIDNQQKIKELEAQIKQLQELQQSLSETK